MSANHLGSLFKRQDSWPLPQSLSLRYGRSSRRRDFFASTKCDASACGLWVSVYLIIHPEVRFKAEL